MCGWTTNHPEHAAVSPDRAVANWRGRGGRKEGKGPGGEGEGGKEQSSERARDGG